MKVHKRSVGLPKSWVCHWCNGRCSFSMLTPHSSHSKMQQTCYSGWRILEVQKVLTISYLGKILYRYHTKNSKSDHVLSYIVRVSSVSLYECSVCKFVCWKVKWLILFSNWSFTYTKISISENQFFVVCCNKKIPILIIKSFKRPLQLIIILEKKVFWVRG